ncbi:selenide, water dikinase SelD [Rhodovulum sp. 12E13]|uniref:selenide, water dikinase SelD n=1 Tax=Rhodovulum sp. 12E13 TaxID=2203891 RepID=UPI000E12D254|nr:selenide, water dikinase SelD [Rhodovulum sp. 12E13]RDC75408.1 selenide, water dikinase SelD [Rhodovulum sp. 12E13]
MHTPVPLTRDLVLIGGGHAHALVLRRWGMRPLPGARLTVINPAPTAPYTGMLPGHVAGHYPREALEIDLVRLARFAGARLVLGAAEGIDRAARVVHVPGRPPIRYDVVSLDVGITSDMPSLPGFPEHGVAAKPLGPFATRWQAFCARVREGGTPPEIAVIGAGVGGVELALAMHHRLKTLGAAPRIAVVEAGDALPGLAPATRRVLFERLRRADIRLIEHDAATEVTAEALRTASGRTLPAALAVGTAGATPHPWLAELGLSHRNGFLTVDRYLRSVDDPAIYASGDCAHLSHAPRPKAGVYAVRAAPVLARNLRADLAGGLRRPFHPQRDYLKLISLGRKEAVADRSGLTLSGDWLWRWKDRIDRRFMEGLDRLPPMPRTPLPAERARGAGEAAGRQPPCAGCGAKVGSGALAAALARLPAPARADVASAPGDDAAILRHGTGWQVVTTDHLRAFTEDPVTLARIAAIHALGDVWAMGAMPQAATATVILPRMTPAMAEATLAELLEPASQAFRAEGAELVGGHTSLGDELTLGFTVTGLTDTPPLTLAGAQPGDALILTKPLGSGTLLAAEMRLRARGEHVAAALAAMARPQGNAARLLAPHARAMTDVTGFGLAGHLWNICAAAGTGARLDLGALPLMPGAETLAASGIRSTLWPENRAALAGRIAGDDESPRAALLFDPQTAGGLLAAVAEQEADRLVTALCAHGHDAARIGTLTDAAPGLHLAQSSA